MERVATTLEHDVTLPMPAMMEFQLPMEEPQLWRQEERLEMIKPQPQTTEIAAWLETRRHPDNGAI